MHTVARPLMTVALDVATYVEAVPQALFSRFLTTTRQTTQTVKSGRLRHRATTPQTASSYMLLVESDITDRLPGALC